MKHIAAMHWGTLVGIIALISAIFVGCNLFDRDENVTTPSLGGVIRAITAARL